MKTNFRAGLLLAVVCLGMPLAANAQLIANEPWEGGVGPGGAILGDPAVSGAPNFWVTPHTLDRGYSLSHTPDWLNGWVANRPLTTIAVIETANSALTTPNQNDFLDYNPGGGFRAASGNRLLRVSGFNFVNMAYRRLGSSINDPNIFFGFLFQVNDGELNELDAIYFWFDNNLVTNHENSPTVGYVCRTAPGNTDITVRLASSSGFSYPPNTVTEADIPSIPSRRDMFIVVEIAKSSGTTSGNYDIMRLWVDPLPSQAGSPDLLLDVSSSPPSTLISSFEYIGIRTEALDNDEDFPVFPRDTFLIDGPRMGRTFPDIVPPGTPLSVDLANLTATRDGQAINIEWQTTAENDTAGFRVHRAKADGTKGEAVGTSIVPAEGSVTSGASYAVRDTTPGATTQYYLVEIELDGSENTYGPVHATGADPVEASVGDWISY